MFRTYSPKVGEVERRWHVVDAADVPLGRLSTDVARLLSGKHKPQWAPHVDTGDFVIVVNAEKAILTGKKEDDKVYHRTSGRPGGLKSEKAVHLRKPMLSVPLANQFEQVLNARYLQYIGYGRWTRAIEDVAVVRDFLDAVSACEEKLAGYSQDGNRDLLGAVDEALDRAAAGVI